MAPRFLLKPAILACIVCIVSLGSWEWYLRSDGVDHAFNDDAPLWAHTRAKVYGPQSEKTVFIGSSRIKFDLDIATWESITGDEAVQLACVGSTPLPILHDLAMDEAFSGKLVIDVTEPLFFSRAPHNASNPKKFIDHYHDLTPAQHASFLINAPLERSFVFLDKDNYSINAMLDKLELESRAGVFMFPIFARDFDRTKPNRQSSMAPAFVADTNQHNQIRAVWKKLGARRPPPISPGALDTIFTDIKNDIDLLRNRGCKMLFVRTPSSGVFWEGEQKNFPREKFWDRLLVETGVDGIHCMDYPETSQYICPEYSHLTPADGIDYTKHLIRQMESKGWVFNKKTPQ